MTRHRSYFHLIIVLVIMIMVSSSATEETKQSVSAQETVIGLDGIVARVNNEIITKGELDKKLPQSDLDKKEILQVLIRNKVMMQAAREENIIVADKEVDRMLESQVDQVGSKEIFEKEVLAVLDVSWLEYRAKIEQQLRWKKFVHSKMGSQRLVGTANINYLIDPFVAPREIKKYYKIHKDELAQKKKIKTRQIILRFKDNNEKITKRAIGEDILKQLKQKADFSKLAQKHSDIKAASGGSWDWTAQGDFPKEVEDIIYQLKEGEISPLIETEDKFWIVKIEGKQGAENKFDSLELQERIQAILEDQKLSKGITRLIRELVKKAEIWPTDIFSE